MAWTMNPSVNADIHYVVKKLTLVCPARTHSYVADVTRLDDIMQGLHLE